MSRWVLLLSYVVVAGCIDSNAVVCASGAVCAPNTVCAPVEVAGATVDFCVEPDQLTACDGKPDASECPAPDGKLGSCHDGVCLPNACNNSLVDFDEACDDGNTVSGDGCSSDCRSTEACGNGITDPIMGEECDDANLIDHDGCTSGCLPERPRWQSITYGSPSARIGAAMAYDAAHHVVVMFGGAQGTTLLDDTWLWDGSAWFRAPTPIAPGARRDGAMAYDAARHRVVLFGGISIVGMFYYGDTWEWDGSTWTPVFTSETPVGRNLNTMYYDAARKRVVLFGGRTSAKPPLTDTWEWDGTTWTHGPDGPVCQSAAMAFDPIRGAGMLVCPPPGATTLPLTYWSYNGTWSQLTATGTVPAPRKAHAVGFDVARGKIVLYGGEDPTSGVPFNELWTWSGTSWTLETAPSGPAARSFTSIASDPRRGAIVVFGGPTSAPDASTWEWNGTGWSSFIAQTPPGAGDENHAIAADPEHGKALMVSTKNVTTLSTWRLDGLGWHKLSPGGPSYRIGISLAYDQGHNQTILFGGTASGTPFDETWRWNGSWTKLTPATSPSPRAQAMLVFDGTKLVLFGGIDGANLANDETWTWTGTDWNLLSPAHKPPARSFAAYGYDPIRHEVVMYGGTDKNTAPLLGDTWIWDGSDWREVTPPASPALTHVGGGMIWDASRQRLVLFGGAAGATINSDSWEWDGTTWTSVPAPQAIPPAVDWPLMPLRDGGFVVIRTADAWRLRWERDDAPADGCFDSDDADSDGLAGCADLDCWAQCSPLCPPGTSCMAGQPACGDGTCSPLETCELCPQDCMCADICGDFTCGPHETLAGCPGDCTP